MFAGLIISILSFALLLLSSIEDTLVLSALFFLNGFGGSAMVISFGAVRELNRPENSATALALLNMGVVGSGAVMQPLVGWLLDLNWTGDTLDGARVYGEHAYSIAFSSILAANILALLCCFLLKETYCQPVYNSVIERRTEPGS